MKYHIIEPEVAGGLGPKTIFANEGSHPPQVTRLEYRIDDWLGDSILECFPCYVVTDELREALSEMSATGVEFDAVEITESNVFEKAAENQKLPTFAWLKVVGIAGHDDFGIAPAPDLRLVISSKALEVLKRCGIDNAVLSPFLIS